jgi:RNA polymerase sigma factor (sigma-70 family)
MSIDTDIDEDFRRALARGDESAWYAFHERFTRRLIHYARAVVKSEELARDTVQTVMVGLVRNRKQLDQVLDFEAYLFSAVRRDLWRALKREQKDTAILVPWDMERNGEAISLQIADSNVESFVEDRDFLQVALSRLTTELRVIIELRFFGELTFEKIGTVLGLPLGTVVSRYRAGLRLLRASVEDQTG